MADSFFITYDFATGEERYRGRGDVPSQILPDGFGIIAVTAVEFSGALTDVPLSKLQTAIWERVKRKRDALIDGGASTPSGVVDSDASSRSNIAGAVLAATIAQISSSSFSMDWTLKDNSVVTLDASDMIALGLAVLAHVNACHDQARTLRAMIDAAADASEVLMIDYTAGWPS